MRKWSTVRATLLVFAGCTIGNGSPYPAVAAWRPPPEEPTVYDTRIVDLRTTLGRAGIALVSRGEQDTIWSSTCALPDAIKNQVGCVRCELAGAGEPIDDAVLAAFKTAFDRYPAAMLVASGMQSVALCKHIEYENLKKDHTTAGTADIYGHRMLLSVEAFEHQAYDETASFTAEDIVHHELYHLFEFERMRSEFMDDPEWRLHNPASFEYKSRLGEARPIGFVNGYSATNEVEDRASVFQYLMTRPSELCEIAKTDEIVRAKTNLVWSRVAARVSDQFLRERATCVDWLTPVVKPRGLKPEQKWLQPPIPI